MQGGSAPRLPMPACWICASRTAAAWMSPGRLHLSVNTDRIHLQNLMAKLGVYSVLKTVALTRDSVG